MCGLCTNGYIFVCPEEPQQWQNPLPTTTNSWNPIQTVKAQAQDHRSFHTSLPIDIPPPTISPFDINDYEWKEMLFKHTNVCFHLLLVFLLLLHRHRHLRLKIVFSNGFVVITGSSAFCWDTIATYCHKSFHCGRRVVKSVIEFSFVCMLPQHIHTHRKYTLKRPWTWVAFACYCTGQRISNAYTRTTTQAYTHSRKTCNISHAPYISSTLKCYPQHIRTFLQKWKWKTTKITDKKAPAVLSVSHATYVVWTGRNDVSW